MKPKADFKLSPPTVHDMISADYLAKLFGVTRRTEMDWGRAGHLTRITLPFSKTWAFDAREISAKLIWEGRRYSVKRK